METNCHLKWSRLFPRLCLRETTGGVSIIVETPPVLEAPGRKRRLLLEGLEQGVDLLVLEFGLAIRRVDDQGSPAGSHPDQVIAQPEDVPRLGPPFEDPEVGV